MPRFFLPPTELTGDFAVLTGENAAHAKVLRLKTGDEVSLCDGEGRAFRAAVRDAGAGQYRLALLGPAASSEAKLRVTVYMAFAKSDKLEHVVQKATELGAFEIAAFPSSRCVSRPDGASAGRKAERWQKIASAAAEQSGRDRIPRVTVLPSFAEAVRRAALADFSCFLYENEQHLSLRGAIGAGGFSTASLMTGPEGGFDAAEVREAQDAGMRVCSLGPRILRCETAPLCALAALLYACGELE